MDLHIRPRLKNYREVQFNFQDELHLNVGAFGFWNLNNQSDKAQKLKTIINTFKRSNIKHIISFHIDPALSSYADEIELRPQGLGFTDEILYNPKIIYDAFCVIDNDHGFTIEQYRYLYGCALKAAHSEYNIAFHCEGGIGRTGTALLSLKILESYFNFQEFFNMGAEELYLECLGLLSKKDLPDRSFSQEQINSLINIINLLQTRLTPNSLYSWLNSPKSHASDLHIYPRYDFHRSVKLKSFEILLQDDHQQSTQMMVDKSTSGPVLPQSEACHDNSLPPEEIGKQEPQNTRSYASRVLRGLFSSCMPHGSKQRKKIAPEVAIDDISIGSAKNRALYFAPTPTAQTTPVNNLIDLLDVVPQSERTTNLYRK